MANFKIFYSWQSDLPSSENRGFIQSCIDAAVNNLENTICIESDRDTKGEFGSPDIASTIFEKIDQCDIFVADVSIINSEHYEKNERDEFVKIQKFSPNPNVLLELGYAAKTISWENIICIVNEDYGNPNQMPFDLDHRRLTPYSLKKFGKTKEKRRISNIISNTILNVAEKGIRPKSGMAAYQVGSYYQSTIKSELIRFKPSESTFYLQYVDNNLKQCRELIAKINNIKLQDNLKCIAETTNSYFQSSRPIYKIIREEKRELYKTLICKLVDEQVDEDFFNLGELKIKKQGLNSKPDFIGSDKEIEKNDLIEELESILMKTNIIVDFWKLFDNFIILPLAVSNVSSVSDTQISIFIKIEDLSAENVLINDELYDKQFKGLEGYIYEYANIKDILTMPITPNIGYDRDISYSFEDTSASAIQQYRMLSYQISAPEYDKSDLEREIRKYIAIPMENSKNEFEFYINNLRPNEKSWLGPSLLLKPLKDEIVLSYCIKSNKTDGSINGILRMKVK